MTLERMGSRSIGPAILLAVALCAGELLSPAVAGEPDFDRVELKVTAAGLDLSTAQGAGSFLERLTVAAENACGGQGHLPELAIYKHCYSQAIVNAVRTINQPVLIRAYVARFPSEAAQFGVSDDHIAAR